jgi:hypothetical protein
VSAGFSIAPPDERILGAGEYLLGALELAVVVAALAFGAYRVRALLLPRWSGAPARLAELVLGIAGQIWVSEALGSVGAFTEVGMLAGSIVVGLGAGVLAGQRAAARPAAPASSPPAPSGSQLARLAAVLACAALAAGWMVPTLGTLAAGMDRADSLWYHMPLSARFVQTGWLGDIYFFDPVFLASFYPANSEVVHAVPILFFDRDFVSPLINLGWLALGLLAAWCIGRPYGVPALTLIGGSIALGSQSLIEFQAGEALNDINGVALVLAALAMLTNGYAASVTGTGAAAVRGRTIAAAPLAIAGLGAGLAAGMKLSFLAPVAALTVGVVLIAPRAARLRTAAVWALPMIAAGGYWYARNLVAVGNPIPYIRSLGPIELPAPVRDFALRPDHAVVHYWNDPDVWRTWFFPGLHDSFGTLWPLTVAGMIAVAIYALWRGGEPVIRTLGALVLVTAVAYVFTPLTAAGEEGEPISFVWNVRYLAPAVAVGLAILPCLPAVRATPRRRAATLIALAVVLAFTVASLVQWKQGHTKGAIAAAALVLAGGAALAWLHSRGLLARTRWRAALAAAAAAAVLVGGYLEQDHYLTHRYENTGQVQDLDDALRWSRDVRDARIAVAGIRGVFNQYPFYGTDLSNHVQWLGERGAHDAYRRIPNCEEWRRAVDDGAYTHVVTTFDPYFPGEMRNSPEGRWTQADPNAEIVVRDGPVRVFELRGPLDPAGCEGQRPLSEAQLHSVPNLSGTPSSSD